MRKDFKVHIEKYSSNRDFTGRKKGEYFAIGITTNSWRTISTDLMEKEEILLVAKTIMNYFGEENVG